MVKTLSDVFEKSEMEKIKTDNEKYLKNFEDLYNDSLTQIKYPYVYSGNSHKEQYNFVKESLESIMELLKSNISNTERNLTRATEKLGGMLYNSMGPLTINEINKNYEQIKEHIKEIISSFEKVYGYTNSLSTGYLRDKDFPPRYFSVDPIVADTLPEIDEKFLNKFLYILEGYDLPIIEEKIKVYNKILKINKKIPNCLFDLEKTSHKLDLLKHWKHYAEQASSIFRVLKDTEFVTEDILYELVRKYFESRNTAIKNINYFIQKSFSDYDWLKKHSKSEFYNSLLNYAISGTIPDSSDIFDDPIKKYLHKVGFLKSRFLIGQLENLDDYINSPNELLVRLKESFNQVVSQDVNIDTKHGLTEISHWLEGLMFFFPEYRDKLKDEMMVLAETLTEKNYYKDAIYWYKFAEVETEPFNGANKGDIIILEKLAIGGKKLIRSAALRKEREKTEKNIKAKIENLGKQ